jgi:hypothetical protein
MDMERIGVLGRAGYCPSDDPQTYKKGFPHRKMHFLLSAEAVIYHPTRKEEMPGGGLGNPDEKQAL